MELASFAKDKVLSLGACVAEGAGQDSRTDSSLLWMQEQGAGLHLQVGFAFATTWLNLFSPREELEAWEQDGLLTLHTAFSRDQVAFDFHRNSFGGFLSCRPLLLYCSCQAEKRYVTHDLREQGTEVWKLLEQGAHLYVCGDAKMMAKVPTSYICLKMVGRWQGRKSNRRMSISCSC